MESLMALLFIAAGIAGDQAVKYWCKTVLRERGTVAVWENVFHLTYAENEGAGFSILSGQKWFLVTVTAIVLILLVAATVRGKIPRGMASWGVYCVISGAIGNLIDRVRQGYVVDLFDFRLIHFAIFNVADVLICTGAGLIALWAILGAVREERDKKQ